MTKPLSAVAVFGLLGSPLLMGCDAATEETGDTNGGREGDDSSESTSDEEDTGTRAPKCDIDELETFDTGLPAGWAALRAGFIEGSGSGSGGDDEPDRDGAWHHTTVEAEGELAPEGMDGGYVSVGGYPDMFEALYTDSYRIDDCESVSLAFTHYFDDDPDNDKDRGELWITVDGPPWKRLGTYDEAGLHEETIDLSDHLKGAFTFQLQFQFLDEDQGSNQWAIDNFELVGTF